MQSHPGNFRRASLGHCVNVSHNPKTEPAFHAEMSAVDAEKSRPECHARILVGCCVESSAMRRSMTSKRGVHGRGFYTITHPGHAGAYVAFAEGRQATGHLRGPPLRGKESAPTGFDSNYPLSRTSMRKHWVVQLQRQRASFVHLQVNECCRCLSAGTRCVSLKFALAALPFTKNAEFFERTTSFKGERLQPNS